MSEQLAAQKRYHDQQARRQEFVCGENVLVLNFRAGPKWLPGQIEEQLGPL